MDGGPLKNVKKRLDEGLEILGAIWMMFYVRSVCFDVKREL